MVASENPPALTSQTPLPPATPPVQTSATADLHLHIHQAADLLANPALSEHLTSFVNYSFKYSNLYPDDRWDLMTDRFATPTEIHETLGSRGLMAVVYTQEKVPVACAITAPWKGDLEGVLGEGEGEGDWEIKTVTTTLGWTKQGLAGRCIKALMNEVMRLKGGLDEVRFLLQTVEEVNGEYWRRRGWKNIRSYERPAGVWGSRHGFKLLVMVQEIV